MRCFLVGAVFLSLFSIPHAFSTEVPQASKAKKSCGVALSSPQAAKLWDVLFNGAKDEPTDVIELAVLDANPKYRLSRGFYKWAAKGADVLPFQGWKFHVACDESNIRQVLELLPELRKMGVNHKVLDSEEAYFNSLNDPEDPNRGKFLTIYPKNDEEAAAIASVINNKLKEEGISKSPELSNKLSNSNLQKGDLALGKSGLFFARYGGIQGVVESIDGSPGIRVVVNGKTHIVPYFDGVEKMLVSPDGKLSKDTRDAVPPWLDIPPAIRSLMLTP